MSLLAMMLLLAGPVATEATQVLAFHAQPSTLVADEFPRLSISLFPSSAIPPSGTITLAVPNTASHPVFAATTPRDPFIRIPGSGCEPFLGRIDQPVGSTRRLVITLPANCILNNFISFELPSDFLEANPAAGTEVTLQASTSVDDEPHTALGYTTTGQTKFEEQAVAAPAPTEASESTSPSPEASESASPAGHHDPGQTPSPESSDEASRSPSLRASRAPTASPVPSASRAPSESDSSAPSMSPITTSPSPSPDASPSPLAASPSPSPGSLVTIALDSTPTVISINTTFSSQYVYQVPSLNIGDNITITFTCDSAAAARKFILLKYFSSNAATHAEVCQIPKFSFINCQNFQHIQQCSQGTAMKFQTLAVGAGNIATTLSAIPNPTNPSSTSSSGSNTSLLYLLFLLFLIPVILLCGFFIWTRSQMGSSFDAPQYESFARPGTPVMMFPVSFEDNGLPPRVPPPSPAPMIAYVPPTPQALSLVATPMARAPLPSPYALPAQFSQPLTPEAHPMTYLAPVHATYPTPVPMQQGMFSKRGMDWWDRPSTDDFSWA